MIRNAKELPVFARLTDQAPSKGDARSFLVTHVLTTAVKYITLLHDVYPVEAVVAIPYSSEKEAVEILRRAGINVIEPATVGDVSRIAANAVFEALQVSSIPLAAQEVGGYLAGFTNQLACFPHFRGIVEDTNNGHWNYERTAPHAVPILSIAQSPLKDIEDTLIGDAVVFSLERILREEFRAVIQGSSSGVIGYGKIGTSSAIAMRGRESAVSIYDINPTRSIRARFEGFAVRTLRDLLRQVDIVIGCTGKTSVTADDIAWMRDGAILVSASSKAHEFDLHGFARVCTVDEMSDVVTRYRCANGRSFYVLSRGTPVNFRDRSILGPVLDLVYSELFVAMRTLVTGCGVQGLSHTQDAVHKEVAWTWLHAYGSEHGMGETSATG
jgi:adenosylhomocysteinase